MHADAKTGRTAPEEKHGRDGPTSLWVRALAYGLLGIAGAVQFLVSDEDDNIIGGFAVGLAGFSVCWIWSNVLAIRSINRLENSKAARVTLALSLLEIGGVFLLVL